MSDSALAGAAAAPARRAISHFEFWPDWLFYAPVVAQWILLGLRHGSMTLPTTANPRIETGGLCGESKTSILDLVTGPARSLIAPYATFVTGDDDRTAVARAMAGFDWPVVIKPDVGCNGTGVRLVHNQAEMDAALAQFPRGVTLVVQHFIPWRGEAGVFYIRHPDQAVGRVTSLTFKIAPEVVGDGRSTLEQLILADERAGLVPHLYLPRLRDRLASVPAQGTVVPLVFAGNHCKGSVFRDGTSAITPALAEAVDAFARSIPDFHFGRVDVRYSSEAALRNGQGFSIIEVNGAGSEATHIWDANCTLRQAYATQFRHYGEAWKIGRAMRARGHRPITLRVMGKAWFKQRRLMASYPMND